MVYTLSSRQRAQNYAFLYCREGRSHEMGLGSVVTATLVDARQKAAQCRALLAKGIDPLETRQSGVEARKKRRAFGGMCGQTDRGQAACMAVQEALRAVGHVPRAALRFDQRAVCGRH
jgi:hypothetical protein